MSHPPPWRDFLVGLTVALGLAGVAALLLMFGEITTDRRPQYPITLALDHASGLVKSSQVTLNGVVVGSVRTIRSQDNPRDGVLVGLGVDEGTRVPRDVSVVLERSLVGDAWLSLTASPASGADPGFLAPGETLTAKAQSMFDVIGAMLDQRLAEFSAAASSFKEMSESFTELGRSARDSLTPRTPEEVDAGAAPNLASTLARLDRAIADARTWLGDDALRADIRESIARARGVMEQASATLAEWSAAGANLSAQTAAVGEQARSALAEFAGATRALGEAMLEVQTLVAGVNRGEGTAGMLAKNPDLYRSLNDAAQRLEKALTEAQLLIEKFRKEGVPIQF